MEASQLHKTMKRIVLADHVAQYTNDKDDLVLQELERQRRVLTLQLDNLKHVGAIESPQLQPLLDGFSVPFRTELETSLAEVVEADLLNEKETDQK